MTTLDDFRVTIRELFIRVGFTPQHTTQMIEGINVIEELSMELGEVSDDVVEKLNQVSLPFVGMVSLTMDYSDPVVGENFVLLRQLLGLTLRAAYQVGSENAVRIQDREDDKDFLQNGA